MRDPDQVDLDGVDVVIHLSSIASEPCGDLDAKLTWEVSCLASMRLADRCPRKGITRFLYASSGSVYGVEDEEQVTEDLELVPISEYNKAKMCAERIPLSHDRDMVVQIVRPATVCAFFRRMRLGLSANMLTMQALTRGRIAVIGGEQTPPSIPSRTSRTSACSCSTTPSTRGSATPGSRTSRSSRSRGWCRSMCRRRWW